MSNLITFHQLKHFLAIHINVEHKFERLKRFESFQFKVIIVIRCHHRSMKKGLFCFTSFNLNIYFHLYLNYY